MKSFPPTTEKKVTGTEHHKIIIRLKKISGQIKGIEKMMMSQEPCLDVVTQIMAARSALAKVAALLIAKESCKTRVSQNVDYLESIISKLIKLQ